MKKNLLSLILISISYILSGQPPDLGLNGKVTWIDATHIKVEYDWSTNAQLLDWADLTTGTTLVRGNGVVTVSGGVNGAVWGMQWKQGITCSRILAENVKTGDNVHVNIYTNNIGGYDGTWNPSVNIGVVLRGWGSVWAVDGVLSDLAGYGPVANSPETYDLNISKLGMTFKSSVDNVLHTYSGALAPTTDRYIALGAFQNNTEWGKLTIEGEIGIPWQTEPVPSDVINIQSNGASFAPVIQVTGNPVIEWVFADATTSSAVTPVKNYGSSGSRHNYLKVTPWSALIGINVGYDASDGGYGGFAIVENQNVLGFRNLTLAKSSLQYLCAYYNLLTELDLRELTALKFVELFQTKKLKTIQLGTHPVLERLCVEDCDLVTLDLSGCANLKDLRGSLNRITTINWGSIGPEMLHICIRDNPQLTGTIPALTQFPKLSELLLWNDNQTGVFVCHSSTIRSIRAYDNHYTSADISGCTSLWELDLSGNKLTSLNLGTPDQLEKVVLKDCSLTESQTDYVLHTLDGVGWNNGQLNLIGNAAPSSDGLVHVTNLKARGWTIYITEVALTSITVMGAGGANSITIDNGTLQLSAALLPLNATNKNVTWLIENGTGLATINASGLVTAVDNGTVTAKASAIDGSGVSGSLIINISNQIVTPTGIADVTENSESVKIIATSYLLKILLNDDFISWKLDLYNLRGNIVLSKFVESDIFVSDISSLPSGIYIVMLSKGENRMVKKFIKP